MADGGGKEAREPTRRLINVATGETASVPQSLVYDHLGRLDERGNPVWRTPSGQTITLHRDDRTGDLVRRASTDAAIRQRYLLTRESNIELIGDPRSEEANAANVRRERRRIAGQRPGLAAVQAASNFTSFGLTSRIERELAGEDISQAIEDLERESPIASGAGTAAGVGLSLFGPGIVSGSGATARGLLGFSERVGARVTTALGGGRAAGIAGRGARAVAVDAPLSLQFQAADLADRNQAFSGQAMAAQTGTDVLWGLGLEAALPAVGVIARNLPVGRAAEAAAGAFGVPGGRRAVGLARRALRNPAARRAAGPRARRLSRVARESAEDASRLDVRSLASLPREEAEALLQRAAAAEEVRGVSGTARPGDAQRLAIDPDAVRSASGRISHASQRVAENLSSMAPRVLDRAGVLDTAARALRETRPDYAGAAAEAARHGEQSLHDAAEVLINEGAPEATTRVLAGGRRAIAGASPERAAEILHGVRSDLVDAAARDPGNADAALAATVAGRGIRQTLVDPSIWTAPTAAAHEAVSDLVDGMAALRRSSFSDLVDGASPAEIARRIDDGLSSTTGGVPSDILRAVDDAEAVAQAARGAGGAELREAASGARSALSAAEDAVETAGAVNRVRESTRIGGDLGRSTGLTEAVEPTQEAARLDGFRAVLGFLRGVGDAKNALSEFLTTGVTPGVPGIGVFVFREMEERQKRAAFAEISEAVQNTAHDPANMAAALGPAVDDLSQVEPETADNVGRAATMQMMYLAENLPQSPSNILGDPAFLTPMADIDVFLERFGALQAPETLLWALAEGSLTEESAEAVRIVYPELFTEIQIQAAEEIAEAGTRGDEDIPYVTKVAASYLLGNGIDPTLDSEFVIDMQQDSAQTQQQEQTLRGPKRSAREPTFSQNAMTVTARVEQL